MRLRLALQLLFTGALLSFGGIPVCAQDEATPADAPAPAAPPGVPVPAPNWPKPVKDNRVLTFVTFDQLEGRTTGSNTSFRWDGEGWIGTDFNKFWFKSEGFVTNGVASDGDQEFLYARPIPRMLTSIGRRARVDIDAGPRRAWFALGVPGRAASQPANIG